MRERACRRRGVALLEVIVALGIFGVAGAAMAGLATEHASHARRARAAEREVRAASDYLDKVALWSTDDLDRHLGDRAQGPWRMTVRVVQPTLYAVELRDTARRQLLLSTMLFRADTLQAREFREGR